MYILHVRIKTLGQTERQGGIVVTHPVDRPLQVHQPTLYVLHQWLSLIERGKAYQGPGLGHKLAG